MGNCIAALKRLKTKLAIDIDYKSMATIQDSVSTVDQVSAIDYTTINTNREFHNEETSTYWLPKDEEEQRRLTGQHFAYKELFGGNLLSSVCNSLDFEKGISVLDIGCGSGVWIMDMINDYPNCTYHGCDIADTTNKVLKISQFTYNHGNVVKGLPYEDNTFDFVHMRFFIFALRAEEWPIAIKEAIRVVKPGGMVQFYEGGFECLIMAVKHISVVNILAASKGQNPDIALILEDLISANDNVVIVQSDYRQCMLSKYAETDRMI
ncbi:hypothetical protein G6F57_004256 [Rhizopus arrhizus]|uniref:Methyltransferase domain-containing protein n=1 Tax=Rhizopus oryzae TaxID=64495 RepID=A0A9P6X940_RHIOR|nr:hypothetical protein G6F21_006559 [Rhizopus arrhizus]KAG1417321.1 hypothetical protein G6F58_005566 [Rhizopus delemar]KAG0800226.1 hypothetical protein G6F22_002441 [Rhizopus arrhizus]KAG0811228.1 hypothetical protein G6F20_007324 [Rhizopus arrhizus]KAG0829797.1 hypothetical protein G6F19_007551 [Rhizopus arrhizus]